MEPNAPAQGDWHKLGFECYFFIRQSYGGPEGQNKTFQRTPGPIQEKNRKENQQHFHFSEMLCFLKAPCVLTFRATVQNKASSLM